MHHSWCETHRETSHCPYFLFFLHNLPAVTWKQLASILGITPPPHLPSFGLRKGGMSKSAKVATVCLFFFNHQKRSRRSRRENKASKVKDKYKVDKYYDMVISLAQSFWSQIDALMTSSWLSSLVDLTLGSFCFFLQYCNVRLCGFRKNVLNYTVQWHS